MADEAKPAKSGDSMKTVQGLAIILIVVLAVFMVTSLNKVTAELARMNRQVEVLVTTTAQNNFGGYQAVDADGKVQFRFATAPGGDMKAMMGMNMMGGSGTCPAGTAAGSAAGACAAPAAEK